MKIKDLHIGMKVSYYGTPVEVKLIDGYSGMVVVKGPSEYGIEVLPKDLSIK